LAVYLACDGAFLSWAATLEISESVLGAPPILYQFQLEMALHRLFTLRENRLFFAKQTRYFRLESVLAEARIAHNRSDRWAAALGFSKVGWVTG
jgi:hypothetical protein